jgi:hypothetical protein
MKIFEALLFCRAKIASSSYDIDQYYSDRNLLFRVNKTVEASIVQSVLTIR